VEQFLSIENKLIELLLFASLIALAIWQLWYPDTFKWMGTRLMVTYQAKRKFTSVLIRVLRLFALPLVFETVIPPRIERRRKNPAYAYVATGQWWKSPARPNR
jgi:hypothetical protein